MSDAGSPVLRVVRGEPTEDELAAVLAVLAAASAGEPASPGSARSPWGEPSYANARLPRPGPGAWRASAWGR